MHTETITWHLLTERLPDDGSTVQVEIDPASQHSEPVWLGYLDGEQWRSVEGDPITVIAWADMPSGTAGVAVLIPPGECSAPDCDCEPGFCLQRAAVTFIRRAPAVKKPSDGYTREGFLRLLHERLAASHLAGREGEGFPASSLKLLEHYFDQLTAGERGAVSPSCAATDQPQQEKS